MPPTTPDRSTCELRHWVVFKPGYHREGEYYSPADMQQMKANFDLLSRGPNKRVNPSVKLSHDRGQKVARELSETIGFASLGDVEDCGVDPDGSFWITAKRIPVRVGGWCNAGRIKGGSIEVPRVPIDDPADPARTVRPPVFGGVALLGGERPMVKGLPPLPPAVFPDGTPVPPDHDASPLLDAMAVVAHAAFAESAVRDRASSYPLHSLCYSDMSFEETPVDPEAIKAALMSMDPAARDAMLAEIAAGGAAAPAAVPPAVDAAGAMPAQFGEFMKKYAEDQKKTSADMAAMQKCYSDMMAAKSGEESMDYGELANTAVSDAILAGKMTRGQSGFYRASWDAAIAAKCFGEGADAVKGTTAKVFAAWAAGIKSMPVLWGLRPDPKPLVVQTADIGAPERMAIRVGGPLDSRYPELAKRKRIEAGMEPSSN